MTTATIQSSTELKETPNGQLTVIDMRAFINNKNTGHAASTIEASDVLDLKNESYIILFSGRRGDGKTTAMSYFAAKCMAMDNMKCMSNYPIEFMLARKINGVTHYYPRRSQPLDMEVLLNFDNSYSNGLIVMDEIPDIVSHMSAMTWKNRLMNIFVRQLRKNNNSLLMAAQQFRLIDKNLQWQTDIEIQCKDARKALRNPAITKGSIILMRWLDHSGNWTGESTEERLAHARAYHQGGDDIMAADHTELRAKHLWGIPGRTKPVFDTLYHQDVWESLRKVVMKLDSIKVGSGVNSQEQDSFREIAISFVSAIMDQGDEQIESTVFTDEVHAETDLELDMVRKALAAGRIGKRRDNSTGKRYYVFNGLDDTGNEVHFDIGAFSKYLRASG